MQIYKARMCTDPVCVCVCTCAAFFVYVLYTVCILYVLVCRRDLVHLSRLGNTIRSYILDQNGMSVGRYLVL